MDQKQRKQLVAMLASMPDNERNQLRDRATKARQISIARNAYKRDRHNANLVPEMDDDALVAQKSGKRKPTESLDEWVLKLLLEETEAALKLAALQTEEVHESQVGTVITVKRRQCDVVRDGEVVKCNLTAEMAANQQTDLAVGDRVQILERSGQKFVGAVLPRRSKLARPDPGSEKKERVIVANVDVIVLVVSVQSPPLHPRLIDRYLIAIGRGGAQAIVVVNKADLVDADDPEFDLLKPYDHLVPVIRCSANSGMGIAELRAQLEGKTSAFVGHSGVGKSSLLNALKPDLDLLTGSVSEGYGRGTHTTTSSHLLDLGHGTQIIDTPGVRGFGLFDLSKDELAYYFPEFDGIRCRFRDCTHMVEPGCGIQEAVEDGDFPRERYEAYRRIYESL